MLIPFAQQLGAELVASMAANSPPETRLIEAALSVFARQELGTIFEHYCKGGTRVRRASVVKRRMNGPKALRFPQLLRLCKDFQIVPHFVKTNAALQRLFYSANFDQGGGSSINAEAIIIDAVSFPQFVGIFARVAHGQRDELMRGGKSSVDGGGSDNPNVTVRCVRVCVRVCVHDVVCVCV